MKCPKCHAENNENSKFCSSCAAPLGRKDGAGPEGATLTRTLETPLHVLKPGSLVAGKYKILEEIGHGGMGIAQGEDCQAGVARPASHLGRAGAKERSHRSARRGAAP
jgi:hypothetical protein